MMPLTSCEYCESISNESRSGFEYKTADRHESNDPNCTTHRSNMKTPDVHLTRWCPYCVCSTCLLDFD